MKGVFKRITRKYYAYTNKWTQHVCTSNNSYGTFTGGGYFSGGKGDRAYFHVSDGQVPASTIGSGGWDGTCWGTTHSSASWFNWHFPEKLRILGIDTQARNYALPQIITLVTGFLRQAVTVYKSETLFNVLPQVIGLQLQISLLMALLHRICTSIKQGEIIQV